MTVCPTVFVRTENPTVYVNTDGDCVQIVQTGPTGPPGEPGLALAPITFSLPGPAQVLAGTARFYLPVQGSILHVQASVGVAPTGDDLVVDVNLNGVSIFTTQAQRPRVAAGTFVDLVSPPDVAAFVANDWLTVDIDQVGSTLPGEDLTVSLWIAPL